MIFLHSVIFSVFNWLKLSYSTDICNLCYVFARKLMNNLKLNFSKLKSKDLRFVKLPDTASTITVSKWLGVLPQVLRTFFYGCSSFSVIYVALTVMLICWYNLLL